MAVGELLAKFMMIMSAIVLGGITLFFLIGACVEGVIRDHRKWMEGKMAGTNKRLHVVIGQPLEVEYAFTPQDNGHPANVEVKSIYAYSGAVRVQITSLLRERKCSAIFDYIEAQCWKAEGLEVPITG